MMFLLDSAVLKKRAGGGTENGREKTEQTLTPESRKCPMREAAAGLDATNQLIPAFTLHPLSCLLLSLARGIFLKANLVMSLPTYNSPVEPHHPTAKPLILAFKALPWLALATCQASSHAPLPPSPSAKAFL